MKRSLSANDISTLATPPTAEPTEIPLLPGLITVRGRVKDGHIALLRESVIEPIIDYLAPYFRDQRPQLKNLLATLTEAKLSKSIPDPFPEDRFDEICAACNITGTNKTEVKTALNRLYDFLNYPKLQTDNAFSNSDYAPSDYKKAVELATAKALNASYAALATEPLAAEPLATQPLPAQEAAPYERNI